jgi:tetratricopeptide (TPR) repeat protein
MLLLFRLESVRLWVITLGVLVCWVNALCFQQKPQDSPLVNNNANHAIQQLLDQGDELARHHKSSSTRLAIEKYDAALKRSEAALDFKGQFRSLAALGHAHEFLNEDERALEYYRRARAVSLRTDVSDQLSAGNDLAALYAVRGDKTPALDHARRVLKLSRKVGDRAAEAQALGTSTPGFGALHKRSGTLASA